MVKTVGGAEIESYAEAEAFLGKRLSRTVARNTIVRYESNGDLSIVLHSTPIVVYHPDETITLNTGGWNTVTTMDRMNQFLPGGHHVTGGVRGKNPREWVVIVPGDAFAFIDNRMVTIKSPEWKRRKS